MANNIQGGSSSVADGYRDISFPFAFGLNRVPYDEYPALLHEGEWMLAASEARARTKKLNGKRYVFLNLRRLGIDEQKLVQPDVLVIRNPCPAYR